MPQTTGNVINAASTPAEVQTLFLKKEIEIEAPIADVWEATLAELGPESQMPNGQAMPLTLEAWPGGRWFRDLGNNTGHFWGNVQVIKPPALLELWGPMMMSYAATNHVQYRLTGEGAKTRVTLIHRAIGQIPPEHMTGVHQGWQYKLERIRDLAARK